MRDPLATVRTLAIAHGDHAHLDPLGEEGELAHDLAGGDAQPGLESPAPEAGQVGPPVLGARRHGFAAPALVIPRGRGAGAVGRPELQGRPVLLDPVDVDQRVAVSLGAQVVGDAPLPAQLLGDGCHGTVADVRPRSRLAAVEGARGRGPASRQGGDGEGGARDAHDLPRPGRRHHRVLDPRDPSVAAPGRAFNGPGEPCAAPRQPVRERAQPSTGCRDLRVRRQ